MSAKLCQSELILDTDTFNCILDMANSEFLDVSRPGLQSLAQFSFNEKNQIFLTQYHEKLLELFRRVMKIDSDFINQRSASVIVVNISAQEDFKEHFCKLDVQLNEILKKEYYKGKSTSSKLYLMDTKRNITLTLKRIV